MAEKRSLERHRKRFSLRFGVGDPLKLAFTEDISSTGLFIKTASPSPIGSIVTVELDLNRGEKVVLEAQVVWAKKVPPQMLRVVKKSGMGVRIKRFICGEADYFLLCEEMSLPPAELL